ncbi:hypothetical protein [Oenococcus oeni]|uniref:hypothetical protein n=1 Tax=Oenococcus oeni TaxID=1247 RepID=UPI0015DF83B7|nr:hypothetical protein [Oenococcus oeni]
MKESRQTNERIKSRTHDVSSRSGGRNLCITYWHGNRAMEIIRYDFKRIFSGSRIMIYTTIAVLIIVGLMMVGD